jgi:hypothetical protein
MNSDVAIQRVRTTVHRPTLLHSWISDNLEFIGAVEPRVMLFLMAIN